MTSKTLGACDANLKRSESQMEKLREELTKSRKFNTVLRSQRAEQTKQCDAALNDCKQQRLNEVKTLRAELKDRLAELQDTRARLRKMEDTMKRQENAFMSQINALKRNKDHSTTKTELEELKKTNSRFSEEMRRLNDAHAKEMRKMREQIELLERGNIRMQTREGSMSNEVKMLNERLKKDRTMCTLQIIEKRKMVRNIKDEMARNNKAKRDMESQIAKLEDSFVRKREQMMARLEKGINQLQSKLPIEYHPMVSQLHKTLLGK